MSHHAPSHAPQNESSASDAGTSVARPDVAVVGGGPAGLMVAEVASQAGYTVHVYDAMPSVGRKFLLAGKGGLNLSHSEALTAFELRYGSRRAEVARWLQAFSPAALRDWAAGLGIQTFVGTSGRVFPSDMKAAPLLRSWLSHLRERGVTFFMRHRWCGWSASGALQFESPHGAVSVMPTATALALGGASWPQLGSNGAWVPWLEAVGAQVQPLKAANCGFEVAPAWSSHLRERFAGAPLKPVVLRVGDAFERQGEFVLSDYGVEGSLVYAAGTAIRERLESHGCAVVQLDLLPDVDAARVAREVAHPRGSRSLSSHLKSRLGLAGVKTALLHELLAREELDDPARLAHAIKALPLCLRATRPVAEAISTAGGVALECLSEELMLRARPGVFCAGEMLDWEAPTGGYLLQATLASGRVAGAGMVHWLARKDVTSLAEPARHG